MAALSDDMREDLVLAGLAAGAIDDAELTHERLAQNDVAANMDLMARLIRANKIDQIKSVLESGHMPTSADMDVNDSNHPFFVLCTTYNSINHKGIALLLLQHGYEWPVNYVKIFYSKQDDFSRNLQKLYQTYQCLFKSINTHSFFDIEYADFKAAFLANSLFTMDFIEAYLMRVQGREENHKLVTRLFGLLLQAANDSELMNLSKHYLAMCQMESFFFHLASELITAIECPFYLVFARQLKNSQDDNFKELYRRFYKRIFMQQVGIPFSADFSDADGEAFENKTVDEIAKLPAYRERALKLERRIDLLEAFYYNPEIIYDVEGMVERLHEPDIRLLNCFFQLARICQELFDDNVQIPVKVEDVIKRVSNGVGADRFHKVYCGAGTGQMVRDDDVFLTDPKTPQLRRASV